jgi:hypothetical protein
VAGFFQLVPVTCPSVDFLTGINDKAIGFLMHEGGLNELVAVKFVYAFKVMY